VALLDHDYRSETLGPTTSTVKRSRFFRGALVNRVGLPDQTVLDTATDAIEFNTTVHDVGGWFDNSTALLRTQLKVPGGIVLVRCFMTLEFESGSGSPDFKNAFISLHQNGILINPLGRSNVTPSAVVNIEGYATAPVPCVPGDLFSARIGPLGDSAVVAGSAISSFGIEAVVG